MEATPVAGKLRSLRIDRARLPQASRRRAWWLLLALVAVVAGAWVLATRPITVQLVDVRQSRIGESVTELTAAGYVKSRRRSVVAPLIPGRLDELPVVEGQRVSEGQVIARLYDGDARVALQQAQARERAARAQLAQARARRELAVVEQQRAKSLAESEVIARQQLDEANAELNASAAAVSAARAEWVAARRAVDTARLNLEHTVVRAPFEGTVVRKLADEGAVLAPAAIEQENVGGILELVDLNALEVEAEVGEDELSRLHIGQPTVIFLDAYPGRVWRGEAELVRPSIDRAKATAVVKVGFRSDTQGVLPDMGVKVAFLRRPLEEGDQHADRRLPRSAVVKRGEAQGVFVVENGRARWTPVQAEAQGAEYVLREGPAAGTPVVGAPPTRLGPGDRVRVEEGE